MSFIKVAKAITVQPTVSVNDWCRSTKVKTASVVNISKIIQKFDPKDWLLSHCTIVASVDVENAPKSQSEFLDYFITPDTEQVVNNNQDAWEKQLLLNSYRTFIGAENYEEHVQIPSLSKGKIIDTVAREVILDTGATSIYVDILVATSRKHEKLCSDILSGRKNELSMGCHVEFTICSKCGKKAYEKEDLCLDILYQKGNHFYDSAGDRRVIAELCGHKDVPNSCTFIEASWVDNGAFRGAVMRNIVFADDTLVSKAASTNLSLTSRSNSLQKYLKLASLQKKSQDAPPAQPGQSPQDDQQIPPEVLQQIAEQVQQSGGAPPGMDPYGEQPPDPAEAEKAKKKKLKEKNDSVQELRKKQDAAFTHSNMRRIVDNENMVQSSFSKELRAIADNVILSSKK